MPGLCVAMSFSLGCLGVVEELEVSHVVQVLTDAKYGGLFNFFEVDL